MAPYDRGVAPYDGGVAPYDGGVAPSHHTPQHDAVLRHQGQNGEGCVRGEDGDGRMAWGGGERDRAER